MEIENGKIGSGPRGSPTRPPARHRAGRLAARGVAALGARLPDATRRRLASELLDYPLWQLPGHYYSPLPEPAAAIRAATAARRARPPAGIDLAEGAQLDLLDRLASLGEPDRFPVERSPGWRFYHENGQLPYADAILLGLLLRHWLPTRIVEVGSGYSTAVMLDTIDRHFATPPEVVSIEPHAGRLRDLVATFPPYFELRELPVQDVPIELFEALGPGDVLFIDSTHVAKAGSDVVHEVFEILPRLRPGVHVHLHDIPWPFEYPVAWAREGRAWNEAYLVRALLTGSVGFEIELFNHMVLTEHRDWFEQHLPGCLVARSGRPDDVTGHGLWIRSREVSTTPFRH